MRTGYSRNGCCNRSKMSNWSELGYDSKSCVASWYCTDKCWIGGSSKSVLCNLKSLDRNWTHADASRNNIKDIETLPMISTLALEFPGVAYENTKSHKGVFSNIWKHQKGDTILESICEQNCDRIFTFSTLNEDNGEYWRSSTVHRFEPAPASESLRRLVLNRQNIIINS